MKIGPDVSEICSRTDRRTGGRVDHNTHYSAPPPGRSNNVEISGVSAYTGDKHARRIGGLRDRCMTDDGLQWLAILLVVRGDTLLLPAGGQRHADKIKSMLNIPCI